MLGLVLTGGGARAAYQAGVLRGVAEIAAGSACPFGVVTGVSAGAVNGMAVAAGAEDFGRATAGLWETWSSLSVADVFRTDPVSIGRIGAHWLRDLSLGGIVGNSTSTHLLDTTPLRKLLASQIDLGRVAMQLHAGRLHGVAVSATDYGSGGAVTFFDGQAPIRPWTRAHGSRVGRRATIGVSHVLASSAIPLFFPPEPIDGTFYGDGCVRLTAPLSPAVHLGADRILAIGIRHPGGRAQPDRQAGRPMSLARIAGVLLNAVFLDSLDGDVERMQRINRTLALVPARSTHPDALRPIPLLAIQPSRDLGSLVARELADLPATLRHMLRGLGASAVEGWDLVSYLAFDAAYTQQLLELGLADARARAREIGDFLTGHSDGGYTGASRLSA